MTFCILLIQINNGYVLVIIPPVVYPVCRGQHRSHILPDNHLGWIQQLDVENRSYPPIEKIIEMVDK